MPYAAVTSVLERMATEYLVRQARGSGAREAHRLTADERRTLQRQERHTIVRACLAGAVAGAILAAVEIVLHRNLGGGLEIASWRDQLPQWAVFLGVTLVVSTAEIAFLYWNAVRMVARYAVLTGLRLLPDALEELRVRGLARAALELPDPRDPVYGIDPYARVSWWRHWAGAVMYRLKVGTTNLVLRAVIRRVLGRAALRFFVPLLAIPVFVVWNGLITWWALRQARIRAFGALAVREHAARLRAHDAEIRDDARQVIVGALGEALARNHGAHPNLVLLLRLVKDNLGVTTGPDRGGLDGVPRAVRRPERT